MAIKGTEAKAQVAKKIIEIFGQDKVIENDKKLYINTTENGEPIQVCITMTCPKTFVGEVVKAPESAFDMMAPTTEPEPFKPVEISAEERETVTELMKRLGL